MKTNKFLKLSLLICTLALMLGAVLAMSVNAADETAAPEITSQNVYYTDKFQLMFAVKADASVTSVTLKVYDAPDKVATDAVVYSDTKTEKMLQADSGLSYDAYIFTISGVSATEMDKNFYVQATDSNGKASNVKKYSVAEYLYQRLAVSKNVTPDQKEFYNDIINFGTDAQKLFGTQSGVLLSDYCYLYVGDEARGIAPIGEQISPYANAVAVTEWDVVLTDKEGVSTTLANQENGFTIPENTIKAEATPVTKIAYPNGTDNLNNLPISSEVYTVNVGSTGVKTGNAVDLGDNRFGSVKNNSVSYQYVYDYERGTVAKFNITGATRNIMIERNSTTLPEGQTATAFECSFDLKGNLTEPSPETTQFFRVRAYNKDYANCYKDKYTYIYTDGSANAFGGGSNNGVTDGKWFNIRLVIYAVDTSKMYIYVNGQTTAAMIFERSIAELSIEDIMGIDFLFYGAAAGGLSTDNILIDNIFCGYTTAVLPTN